MSSAASFRNKSRSGPHHPTSPRTLPMQLFAACTHHGRKGGRRQLPLIVVAIVVGSFAAVLILWLAMSESTRDVVTKRKPDSTVSSRNAAHSESDSRAAASTEGRKVSVAQQQHPRGLRSRSLAQPDNTTFGSSFRLGRRSFALPTMIRPWK